MILRKQRKDEMIWIRATAETKSYLVAKAAELGMPMGAYLMMCAMLGDEKMPRPKVEAKGAK